MPISSEAYRDVLRHFAAGVTIVTVKAGEQTHGLTVSAFASVSPQPPLICVIIDQRSTGHEMLEREGAVFAVNILAREQMDLSNRFAWIKDQDRFAEGKWTHAVTGAPVLEDALAWLDCTIVNRYPAGTHTLYIGEVQASAVNRPGDEPLLYWNRGYRHLLLREDEP